jgi:hypothetical protein
MRLVVEMARIGGGGGVSLQLGSSLASFVSLRSVTSRVSMEESSGGWLIMPPSTLYLFIFILLGL